MGHHQPSTITSHAMIGFNGQAFLLISHGMFSQVQCQLILPGADWPNHHANIVSQHDMRWLPVFFGGYSTNWGGLGSKPQQTTFITVHQYSSMSIILPMPGSIPLQRDHSSLPTSARRSGASCAARRQGHWNLFPSPEEAGGPGRFPPDCQTTTYSSYKFV